MSYTLLQKLLLLVSDTSIFYIDCPWYGHFGTCNGSSTNFLISDILSLQVSGGSCTFSVYQLLKGSCIWIYCRCFSRTPSDRSTGIALSSLLNSIIFWTPAFLSSRSSEQKRVWSSISLNANHHNSWIVGKKSTCYCLLLIFWMWRGPSTQENFDLIINQQG